MTNDTKPIVDEELEANAGSRFVSDGEDFTITSPKRACLTCEHEGDKRNTCEKFPRIDKEILRGGECSEHEEREATR